MTRFVYYLIFTNMLLNIMVNVPNVLIHQRFSGALSSVLLAAPVGWLLTRLFLKGMSYFPGQNLDQIFRAHLSPWLRAPIQLFHAIMWLWAGALVLLSYSYIMKAFLTQDMPYWLIVLLLLTVVIYGATRKPDSILYFTEIVFWLSLPLITFVLYKALSTPQLSWDSMWALLDYAYVPPRYSAFAAATYIYIGYINMGHYNLLFPDKIQTKHDWIVPISGLLVSISSMMIPIGFEGLQQVDRHLYPWVSTADSITMHYGFIERLVYLLLLLYLGLTLLYAVITWNAGYRHLVGALPKVRWKRQFNFMKPVVVLALIAAVEYISYQVPEPKFLQFVAVYLNLGLPGQLALIVTLLLLGRVRMRRRRLP